MHFVVILEMVPLFGEKSVTETQLIPFIRQSELLMLSRRDSPPIKFSSSAHLIHPSVPKCL